MFSRGGKLFYILLGLGGFFAIAFLFTLSPPPSPPPLAPVSIKAHELNPPLQLGPAITAPAPPKCPPNPFLTPGYLTANNTWTPLSGCPGIPPSSLPSLLPNLANKTFYFYGDSVARRAMTDACLFLTGKLSVFPNPPGYRTQGPDQAINVCHLASVNFTAVNVYNFGMRVFSDSNEIDRNWLQAHPSIRAQKHEKGENWLMENRMLQAHGNLVARFGTADAIVMGSGIWDLAYLQQWIVREDVVHGVPQTELPPANWTAEYQGRITKFWEMARDLHAPTLRRQYWITLHQPYIGPGPKPINKSWGFSGTPKEFYDKAKFLVMPESRVMALRNAQIQAVMKVLEKGNAGVPGRVLPYAEWIHAVDRKTRMNDRLHPSSEANKVFGLAMTVLAEEVKAEGEREGEGVELIHAGEKET